MKLLQYRQEHGLTQSDVAVGIGAAVTTVSDYENGRRTPRREIMARIAVFTKMAVTANDFHGMAAP